jgi:hypothetical protein
MKNDTLSFIEVVGFYLMSFFHKHSDQAAAVLLTAV